METEVVLLHLLPAMSLLLGLWVLPHLQGFNLVQHPAQTLRIAGVWQVLFSVSMYSVVSVKQKKSQSIWEALGRSIFSLPIGALIMIIVAIIFGAPLDFDVTFSLFCRSQGRKTAYWGQLISSLVVVPAGIVFGKSWSAWERVFAFTRPRGALEFSICIPAHGAVIGAWFGAWPMPLDWDRPWQEWPVCVTYGMAVGFVVGEIVSLFLASASAKKSKD